MSVTAVYTIDEVLEQLNGKVHKTSIYRAIECGRLKAVKVGRKYLISEKVLNAFLEGTDPDNFKAE